MLLVDASVWITLGEAEDRHYEAVRRLIRERGLPMAALDLTLYEIANVVGAREKKPESARYIAQAAVKRCENRLIAIDGDLLDLAVEIAIEHGITAYDAAYVAAARRGGMTLVSNDVADLVSRGLAVMPADAL